MPVNRSHETVHKLYAIEPQVSRLGHARSYRYKKTRSNLANVTASLRDHRSHCVFSFLFEGTFFWTLYQQVSSWFRRSKELISSFWALITIDAKNIGWFVRSPLTVVSTDRPINVKKTGSRLHFFFFCIARE